MTDAPEAPEVISPEAAREEAAALNADKDGPLFDQGYPKHLKTIDRLAVLLSAVDVPPAEGRTEAGERNLERLMESSMEPVEALEGYYFDAYARPEGSEWDGRRETAKIDARRAEMRERGAAA